MTEALPEPTEPSTTRTSSSAAPLIIAATVILLGAVGGAAYVLNERLVALASVEPQAPREVTDALDALQSKLDKQTDEQARQVEALQKEIAELKEQQAQTAAPDIEATLVPVQEKLDAIAQKLEQPAPASPAATPADAPVATDAPEETAAAPSDGITAEETAAPENGEALPAATLRHYLALRRAVESGAPFEAELEALEPQVGALDAQDQEVLYTYADTGLSNVPAPRAEEMEAQNPGWMQRINTRLAGLVTIRRSDAAKAQPGTAPAELDVTREDVLAALDKLEAHVMKATE